MFLDQFASKLHAMPQQLGPAMLANLDQRLQSGEINQPTYDARRVEVMELIRQGKAYSLTSSEKAWRTALGVTLMVIGLALTLIDLAGNAPNIIGLAIGIGLTAYGANRLREVRRH